MNPQRIEVPWSSAPAVTAPGSTLLDHAASVTDGSTWIGSNEADRSLGLSFNCVTPHTHTEVCYSLADAEEKTPRGPSQIRGTVFAAYSALSCKPFGFTLEEGQEEIRRTFLAKESASIERGLMDVLMRALVDEGADPVDPDDDTTIWPAAPVIAGTGVSPRLAVARLEEAAGLTYVGLPVIHVPTVIGSLLAQKDAIRADSSGKFFTPRGSKVVIGDGYSAPNHGPDGSSPAAGKMWAYATGEVVIQRGKLTNPEAQLDRSTNEIIALAEREYLVATDCFSAAILVNVED